MDAGRTPVGVFVRHGLDQGPNIARGGRPSDCFAPGVKAPIKTETLTMPPHHRFRLNDQKRLGPVRPEVAQQNPKQPVGTLQPCPLGAALQNNQLVLQSNDFKSEMVARSNEALQPGEYRSYQPKHQLAVISRRAPPLLRPLTRMEFWRPTTVMQDSSEIGNII